MLSSGYAEDYSQIYSKSLIISIYLTVSELLISMLTFVGMCRLGCDLDLDYIEICV